MTLTFRADTSVDASEAAQIMAIDKTFSDVTDQDLEEVRHPDAKKKSLRVVEVGDHVLDRLT